MKKKKIKIGWCFIMFDVVKYQLKIMLQAYDNSIPEMKFYREGCLNGAITILYSLDILDSIHDYCLDDFSNLRKIVEAE